MRDREHLLFAASIVCVAACGAPDAMSSGDDSTEADAAVVASDAAMDGAVTGVHGYTGAYKSPTIVRDGSTYHAYFAADRVGGGRRNTPHATFTADGDWTFVGEALPTMGAQALDDGNYPVWAPAVARIDPTHWMLYYTGQLSDSVEKKCIWRAHAASADGPFVDDYGGPMYCADASLWAIDPYLVKDAQGDWHLAARIDEAGGINTVKIRKLGPLGAQFATGSAWIELTRNQPTSWEQPVLENAGVVRLHPSTGDAHWFVFYSGGAWDDNSYAVGYADCGTSINGPCTKKTPTAPWLATKAADGVFGPGTPTFYTNDAGDQMMSVQAWRFSGGKSNPMNDGQIMRTYTLTVDDNYAPHASLVRVDL